MTPATILVLGGYGNTGRALARLLLTHTEVNLIVAGRHGARAEADAHRWNEEFGGQRVRAREVDAADGAGVRAACDGAQWLIAASSTSDCAAVVAEAALAAGVDYMDPQFARSKLAVLESMADRIRAAGRCFVTEAGFHPGLPAALVRFAAPHFEALERARVGSVIQIDWSPLEFSSATMDELINEFRDYRSESFREGRWRPMGWLESLWPIWMTFSHGYGRRYTMPMYLDELRGLPEAYPTLRDAGFYVGGFNPVVDFLLLPLIMGWLWIAPERGRRAASRLLMWGLKRFTPPPYGTLLQLEAEGLAGGARKRMTVEVFHPDGYVLTAAPMAACLMQLLDGSARTPGLHDQAWIVEPVRFLEDLMRMGIEVQVNGPA
jgi:saccharopine dehydrogenase (NAD+, L-lysine-forming)